MSGEFSLIARHFSRPVRHAVLGVGDDCALLAPSHGCHWAVSTDTLVVGRHFSAGCDPAALGHKALAVNLSDLAACGATPRAVLLALTLPEVDDAWLAALASGLYTLADAHGAELVGGDTTCGPLALTLTVMGEVPVGQALRRDGARAGDALWVSGTLGEARLALEQLRGALPATAGLPALRQRLERPTPRVALGEALRGVASSAIDLSDGLLGDLGHVLRASRVGAVLDWQALPATPEVRALPGDWPVRCLLTGGDDYELAFTAPASADAAVRRAAAQAGVAVSRVGRITEDAAATVQVLAQGVPLPTAHLAAWDHFAPAP